MKAFIISWMMFLALLSLILTGAFMLTAHGNEFGSTSTSSATQKVPTPDYTIPILIFIVLAAIGIIIRVAVKRTKQ